MSSIMIENFIGEYPKLDPRLLPDNAAQTAKNCDLRSGKIVPDYAPIVSVEDIDDDVKTIYGSRTSEWSSDWGEGFTTDWVMWTELTYYFESPFAKETLNRIYTLQYLNEDSYSPMQYEGIGIDLQDLTFLTADTEIVATYIDRSDPEQNSDTVTGVGSDETTTNEQASATFDASFDTIICVGSANPSNNVINGDSVTFDYNLTYSHSDDDGVTWTTDDTETATYDGNVLYSGGTSLYISPAITASHSSTGATDIRIAMDASGNDITMDATGSSYAPSGEILDRYYCWTYVYENGEEGQPSELSNLATIYKGDYAELTNIGTDTAPDDSIVTKRIYCTSGGIFKVLGEIDVTETTFTDDIATTALYGELLTANNPQDMQGMILSPLGFTVGWDGRDILFSNEYLPYAWDDSYTITVKYHIVGMVSVNDIIYVLTEGQPYILSGYTISSMSLEEIPEPQSCVSRTGMVRYRNSAFYISPDGIIQLSGGSSSLFTRPYFNKRTWSELSGESGALSVHDDILQFTTDTAHYRFALADETMLTQGEIRTNVLFEDLKEDELFYKDGTEIKAYLSGTELLTATWRSKEEDFKTDTIMSVGRVIADSYDDLTFNVYADGILVSTTTVLNNKPFRLAGTTRANTWSMETVSTDTISCMQIGQTMVELK